MKDKKTGKSEAYNMLNPHEQHKSGGPALERRELVPMAVAGLKDNTVTDFDLYLDVGGHLVLYAPSPYRWSEPETGRLIADGFREVFYAKSDEAKVQAYHKISVIKSIDESLEPAKRVIDITDAIAELTRILYEHPLSPSGLDKGKEIASSLTRCVSEDLTCIQALGQLAHHDYYTYYHSARVGAYALALAIRMSLTDTKRLEEMGTGCILHDVGKAKVGLQILNKAGPLTVKEWGVMKLHPEYGSGMVDSSQLGHVPREIILHHHERIDGRGYPHGLTSNELLEEVKIAAFADVFDALTTNRPYSQARTRFEALDFIRFNMLDHLYKDAYKAMVEVLVAEKPEKKAG